MPVNDSVFSNDWMMIDMINENNDEHFVLWRKPERKTKWRQRKRIQRDRREEEKKTNKQNTIKAINSRPSNLTTIVKTGLSLYRRLTNWNTIKRRKQKKNVRCFVCKRDLSNEEQTNEKKKRQKIPNKEYYETAHQPR